MIQKIIESIFGKKSDKDIKAVMPTVEAIKTIYEQLPQLSHDELRAKTNEFKQRISDYLVDIDAEIDNIGNSIKNNPDLDPDEKEERYKQIDELKKQRDEELEVVLKELLPEAFAVMRETARRFSENSSITVTATALDKDLAVTNDFVEIQGDKAIYKNSWMAAGAEIVWNMVHYEVQLIGGVILHQGKIAEMQTGEGKTLVSTLPAYLNGLAGQGVHIVTVNDYLAKRDSEWQAPIFNFLGLTIDCIDKHRPNSPERRAAYNADITYGTNNEFGFDYLRDNMVRNPEEMVQRKHHYAMIDEVDSVLIDDARTPLIISGPVERGDEHEFDDLKPRIEKLIRLQKNLAHKFFTEAKKQIEAGNTDEKTGGLALLRAFRGFPKYKPLIKYLSEPQHKLILQNAENFYLQEQAKRMPEVDAELLFIIEEKNRQIDLTEKGIDTITGDGEDPNFFIMPEIATAMADIETNNNLSEDEKLARKDEVLQDFAVKSERIHSIQQLLKAYALFENNVDYVVLDDQVKIVDEQTGRIMEGRRYSDGLHQALEAKEGVKIEAATQTFATVTLQNFFRMYHKLSGMTGTAETEAGEFWEIYNLDVVVIPTNRPIQRIDSNDLIYRTQREKFNAVIEEIEQLRSAGRPVLVGTTSVETSELLSKLLQLKKIDHNVLNAKQHAREADIVANAGKPGVVTIATNMAGRGTDIKLSDEIKEAGGLAIIGTERHDARRVDRQLRGRAGRQGDPGSSQFYVSLEDNLMRLFGSDKMAKVMDRMGYKEGEVLQHSMVTKSIENAQKKVEENNFGTRKRLLDYDEVMNAQRNVVYKKRRHALYGERLSVDLNNTFRDLCEEIVFSHKESGSDFKDFELDTIRFFAIDTAITERDYQSRKPADLADQLYGEVAAAYKRKNENIVARTRPFFEQVHAEKGDVIKRIIVPVTDGQKGINVVVNLEEALQTNGKNLIKELEKTVSLAFIDDEWKQHLRKMDDLKQSVQTAQYEQKDPLLIFKQEAFGLFQEMVTELNKEITSFLFRANLPEEQQDASSVQAARQQQRTDLSKMQTGRNQIGEETTKQQAAAVASSAKNSQGAAQVTAPIRRQEPKVGRNEPCPCGSGKKYKHCHGRKVNA